MQEPLSQSKNIDDEITQVLGRYPVGALKETLPATGGVMNENWFVDTDTGRYFLKRRNPFFSSASIEFELKLIDYLSGRGFPTPRLIRTSDGALSVYRDSRYWELYEYISGEPFQANNPDQIRSAARLLAKFHRAAAGYQERADGITYRRMDLGMVAGMVDQLKETVANELRNSTFGTLLGPGIISFIEAQEEAVINGILPLSGSLLTIIHGDYQPSNVIFKGSEAAAVIDFGNAALSYRSYDVARAILSFSSLNPDYKDQKDIDPWLDLDRVKAFFNAYQSEMPISEAGIQAIPALIRGTFLFGISFYIKIETDLAKKAAFLMSAVSFINWLDASEDDLRSLLLEQARSLKLQGPNKE